MQVSSQLCGPPSGEEMAGHKHARPPPNATIRTATTMPNLAMHRWTIELADDEVNVNAAYWSVDPDTKWVEFKDVGHAVVYGAPERQVNAIYRATSDAPESDERFAKQFVYDLVSVAAGSPPIRGMEFWRPFEQRLTAALNARRK